MTAGLSLRLFVHVEEPSMKEALTILLPSLLAPREIDWTIIDHGSKKALLSNMPARLSGYARWADPGIRVLILVDRDNDDCKVLKRDIEHAAVMAGLATKSEPDLQRRFQVVSRIVVDELESWFFGDVPALSAVYPGVPANLGAKSAFRDPDAIKGGTWEALLRVLKGAGHYAGSDRLPKIEVARRISARMVANRNRSHSFKVFVAGLEALLNV